MGAREFRAEYERWMRALNPAVYPDAVAVWAVRRGDAEVHRQVDENAVFEALTLLEGVDLRRYALLPEIRETIRAARAGTLDAARALSDRSWPLYRADREAPQ